MIRLVLGNIGSGKTAHMVREMISNKHKIYYTNIKVQGKGTSHIHYMTPNMLIQKIHTNTKRTGEQVFDYKLNTDFWLQTVKEKGSINIVIDEAHQYFNPRRSMSKLNIIMTDFLALLRRLLGSQDGNGDLVLISQLHRRLDVISREMATNITYCKHHYMKSCKCGIHWGETNETPQQLDTCPACGSFKIKRHNHLIEIWKFVNMDDYEYFKNAGMKTYYRHYLINNIHEVFGNYDTVQIEDLLSLH